MPFCPQCGSEINAEDRFCPACGSATEPDPVAAKASRPVPTARSAGTLEASSATTHPQAHPGRRTGLMVGGGCLALLVLGAAIVLGAVFLISGGAADAAETHFEMLKSGEIDLAWRNTSEAFRSTTPVETYRALVASRPALGQIATIAVPSREVENGIATLLVHLTTTTGSAHDVPVQARKETDGQWRVSALDYSALPAAAAPPAASATPAPVAPPAASATPAPASPTPTPSPNPAPPMVSTDPPPPPTPPVNPAVREAMTAADAFYAWYLAKWEEPDIEPAWFETSDRLTPVFQAAWKRVQQRGVRPGEEPALDYDLVICAQEVPHGGFRAVHGEPGAKPNTVRVIMLAVGWDMTLDVRMQRNDATGAWQVDAIQDLNQDLSVLPDVEIPPSRRSEATLEAFFDLLKTGEPWQAYALATTGFKMAVSTDALAAFVTAHPEWKAVPPLRFRETAVTPVKRIYALEFGGVSGEAILIDEAGEKVWSVHRLQLAGQALGATLSPALDAVIGEVLMSHQLDPATGRITEENHIFDAATTDPIYLEIPVSGAYPGLEIALTVPAIDSDRLLVDGKQVAPEGATGTWLFRWQIPHTGPAWPVGDYELTLSITDGMLRREVFGLR